MCIIPNDGELSKLSRFGIAKNLFKTSKYDRFKVDPKPYDSSYQDLMLYIRDKKFFGIEDIKAWLRKREKEKLEKEKLIEKDKTVQK